MTTLLHGPALIDGAIVTTEIAIDGERIAAVRPLQPTDPATPGSEPVLGTIDDGERLPESNRAHLTVGFAL